jgi:hypothetical protein
MIPNENLVGISGKKQKKIVRCFQKWNARKGRSIFHKGLIEQKYHEMGKFLFSSLVIFLFPYLYYRGYNLQNLNSKC